MARAGYGHRVEGLHAVAAAAGAGRVQTLHVESERARRPEILTIVAAVESSGGSVRRIEDARRLAETAAPQGVVADCRAISPVTLEEAAAATEPAAVMVLDRVVDPHNLGAIARSSVAAGVPGLVVASRRAAPLSATAFKAAAGALEHARVATVGSVAEAVSRLKRLGLWTIGLSSDGEKRLFGLDLLTEPVALVMGGEGGGLSRLVEERLDLTVSVPMPGPVESLNVSVAAALASFELTRARFYQ